MQFYVLCHTLCIKSPLQCLYKRYLENRQYSIEFSHFGPPEKRMVNHFVCWSLGLATRYLMMDKVGAGVVCDVKGGAEIVGL